MLFNTIFNYKKHGKGEEGAFTYRGIRTINTFWDKKDKNDKENVKRECVIEKGDLYS